MVKYYLIVFLAFFSLIARLALAQAEAPVQAEPATVLRLVSRTPLPGYAGDFDHLTADLAGQRLFVAGEDGGTVEVFDLRNARHLRTIKGFASCVHTASSSAGLHEKNSRRTPAA